MIAPMNREVLFQADGWHAHEVGREHLPQIQAWFEADPAYWLLINGRPPRPDQAEVEFDERPPPHLPFGSQRFIGLHDGRGALAGVAIVVSDLGAPGVWHVALFIVATAWHGTGVAGRLFEAMARWMADGGATWLRLSVVKANPRAERFWRRMGFVPLRVRTGVDTGGRLNDVQVMVKPLRPGADLASYLARVPRDAPGSLLP